MALNLKKIAKEVNSNSLLQIDRTKKQWADVDGTEVTIIAVDRNLGPKKDPDTGVIVSDPETGEVIQVLYSTVLLAEYQSNFFGGFSALDRIIDRWMENATLEEINAELKKCGGVKIKTHTEFKNSKNSRKIDYIL